MFLARSPLLVFHRYSRPLFHRYSDNYSVRVLLRRGNNSRPHRLSQPPLAGQRIPSYWYLLRMIAKYSYSSTAKRAHPPDKNIYPPDKKTRARTVTASTRCVPTSGYFFRAQNNYLRTSSAMCIKPRPRCCCHPRPSVRGVLTRFRRRCPQEHRSRKSPDHLPAPSRCSLRHPRGPCARVPFAGGTWRPSPVFLERGGAG